MTGGGVELAAEDALGEGFALLGAERAIGVMLVEPPLIQRPGHAPRCALEAEADFVHAARVFATALLNEQPEALRVAVGYACERLGARLWVSCMRDAREIALVIEYRSGRVDWIGKRRTEVLH